MSTKRITFNFKGLMAPVFTAFKNDETKSVDVSQIDKYAAFLKQNDIHGVLVNGTTGEGPVMNVEERKLITENWLKACRKYQQTIMVQIGGAPLADVIELAKHAENLKVDAVLCLPELYFKPNNLKDFVGYFKQIASYCPNIPFLYYHIPKFTGISFHMPTFCDLAENQISNFVGLKYTSNDMGEGSELLIKSTRNIFLGADTILTGAFVLGFDSAIMTTLNICPELFHKCIKSLNNGNLNDAKIVQDQIRNFIKDILQEYGDDWVGSMKKEFNKKIGINVGPIRNISI